MIEDVTANQESPDAEPPIQDAISPVRLHGEACIDCGSPDAPHRGETITTRVAPGVVRDTTVARCTPCVKSNRSPKPAEASQ